MLGREREDGAEREAIHADDVERAESEDDSRTEREERHHDVVREDGHRQDGGGRDVEQSVGPQLATFDGGDELWAREEAMRSG
jgi:hypothetical protein